MCVAAIAWEAHPQWRLVAIGNRDEFHERPALPLDPWHDGSGIIAGRDLTAGGTWLGVTPHRFALITNLRGFGEPQPGRESRGGLVVDALLGAPPADLSRYNPFNLFVAEPGGARFLTNRPEPVRAALTHGIYGLSNGPLDEPWPKTLQLKAALLDWLVADGADIAPLFAALASETLAAVGLPHAAPSDVAAEAPQTAPFIRSPVYGTRCSTVVAIGRDGSGTIVERRFDPAGEPEGESRLAFAWPL
jgi:uncharacterized protein with NRDE domain